jgi:predicted DNA-binding transcriptional regulator AlpA
MAKPPAPNQKYLTRTQLMERWGVSHMFIERLVKTNPTFPPHMRLGDGRLATRRWRLDEIEAWERSRVAGRSA